MLTRTFRIARIAGIEIKWHWSLPLLVVMLFVLTPPRAALDVAINLIVALVFIGSILLHELGHGLIARWLGYPVQSIVLWPYGGFALLKRQPARVRDELAITAAGPAVNLIIAAVALLLGGRFSGPIVVPVWVAAVPIMAKLVAATINSMLFINTILGTLNLLPIYPLDGGRLIRAGLRFVVGALWADRITLVISIPLALAGIGYTVLARHWLDLPVGLLILLGAAMLQPQVSAWVGRTVVRLWYPALHLVQHGQLDRAIALIERRIASHPNDARAYAIRGYIALQQRQYQQMRAAYGRAKELNPSAEIVEGYAYAAHLSGDNAQALTEAAAMLRDDPSSIHGHTLQGLVALDEQQIGEAAALFEEVVRLAPDLAMSYNNRGYVRLLQGDDTGALEDLLRASALDPTIHQPYLNRGRIAVQRGDSAQALVELDQAVTRNAHEIESYLFRSMAHAMRGETDAMRQDVDRAIAIDPEEALVQREIWLERWAVGRLDWARQFYQQALASSPASAAAFHGRADALRVNGLLDEAIADYNRALAIEPGRAGAYAGRGLAFGASRRCEQARSDLAQALAADPSPHVRRLAQEALSRIPTEPVSAESHERSDRGELSPRDPQPASPEAVVYE